jgi:transketolase
MTSREKHDRMANAIRFLSMDAVQAANSGHPGLPMGAADIATVLFSRFMKFDPMNPSWPDRDRFVLSAGHGSMLLYALLYLLGYEDISIDEIRNFRQLGARPPAIRNTATPRASRRRPARSARESPPPSAWRSPSACWPEFGDDLVDHYTYVIAGDGCLMEGISHEALSLAGHLKLSKLIVLWDDNGISIDGKVSISDSTDQQARFEASGWHVLSSTATIPTPSPRPSSARALRATGRR